MGLLWIDGFESYNNTADVNALSNLYSVNAGFGTTYSRRVGSSGARINYNNYYMFETPGEPATIKFGIAFQYTAGNPVYALNTPMFIIYDSFYSGNIHLNFYVNSSKKVEVRNSAGTLLGTSSGHDDILIDVWYYIEISVTINDSTGAVIIKLNETQILSLSGIDTQNGSNAFVGAIVIQGIYNISTNFDDLYCLDTTGDAPHNDFLGDVRIDPLRPSAAGTYTDFTPSAGSNYQNVDETYGPDDDTTYNQGSDVADQDSYQTPDLPAPAGTTIYGVKSQITVRKTDAGVRKCKLLTRVGTTDDLGDEITLSDSYTTHAKIFEDNPDDSAAFEDADVNAMEVGVEITA